MTAVLSESGVVFGQRDYSALTPYWMVLSQQEGADKVSRIMGQRAEGLITADEWRASVEEAVAMMTPGPVKDLFVDSIAKYRDPHELKVGG